ncbi:MAG: chain length determinant protein EpsF [Pseudomonadota bacterium]
MNFSQFLVILRMRRKIILSVLILTVLATLALSLVLPKNYKATATLVLNYKGVDPISGVAVPAQLMPGYVATQVDIITSRSVALKVVDDLKIAENPAVKEDFFKETKGKGDIRTWLADALSKRLEVTPARESSVIDIVYKGPDPRLSADLANAFANAYQQVSVQLKVEPLKQAALYFSSQVKSLQTNLEAAQTKLSQYQHEKGIVNVDNRLDIETSRLNELSAQLVIAQGQRMEASSRRNNGGVSSPDVVSNPLVQRLKEELSTAESKLSEASEKYGTNHPLYIGAKAEADKLRSSLNEQIKTTISSVSSSERIYQQREGELRATLNAQKTKVLQLNRDKDEHLSLLMKEVEVAQHAYEAVTQRFNQTNLEGQSNQSDVALLNPAVAPLEPASPNIVLNTLLSVILGSLLGLMFGFLAEIVDRPVRTEADLIDALQAPVLGTLEWKASTRRRSIWSKWLSPRYLRSN